jgi:hypothetical protein
MMKSSRLSAVLSLVAGVERKNCNVERLAAQMKYIALVLL